MAHNEVGHGYDSPPRGVVHWIATLKEEEQTLKPKELLLI
jgi:hypothetical protein